MNVLVYSGPGVSQTSFSYTISSLKEALGQNYVVQAISPKELASDPWAQSCALLVIPGGRDLPYLSALGSSPTSPAIANITTYVRGGGSYLGICAGAYFASSRVEWEVGTPLEVRGDRPLKFFPGISEGCVFPGFQYESENGARVVSIVRPGGKELKGLYYNGGGQLLATEEMKGITTLAWYGESDRPGMLAGSLCNVEKGRAALWHVHIEFPATSPLVVEANKRTPMALSPLQLSEAESDRKKLLQETLNLLGLKVPEQQDQTPRPPSHPLPQYLCFTEPSTLVAGDIYNSLNALKQNDEDIIDDANDRFRIWELDQGDAVPSEKLDATKTGNDETRHIIFCRNGPPELTRTPHFSVPEYFARLRAARANRIISEPNPLKCPIGEILLYGEAVTSTQTLLERNPKILEVLPAPILSLASYQFSGRGRGSNVWASPPGCLLWSLLLRVPPQFPNNKLVFVQYLVGIAVVEACREVLGHAGDAVVLKWPNDIYAKVETPTGTELRKIGGILINTAFLGGGVRIIAGCGLNVHNSPPIMSLSQLSATTSQSPGLTIENLAAVIMAVFAEKWQKFVAAAGSFEPFMDAYLAKWLHSDQLVTLETVKPPIQVRIVGITPDYGLLRTVPEKYTAGQPQFIDLQPDGNSFDMMAGLIRTKR